MIGAAGVSHGALLDDAYCGHARVAAASLLERQSGQVVDPLLANTGTGQATGETPALM